MDDYMAHAGVAFLTPLAWGLIIYPLARKFNKDWVALLTAALFLSFVVMILKELGDPQISRNDIVSDLVGLFFGTAALAFLFFTGNAATEKARHASVKVREGSAFSKFLHDTLPRKQEVSLRELLLVGLKLAHFGARFYGRIANSVKDPQARKMCRELVQIETRHAERLSAILNAWLPRPIRPSLLEWTQMFVLKNDLYTRKFPSDASEKEILKYAISCEEKMKKFYGHFRDSFPEEWKRVQLDEIIQAKTDHKDMLGDILEELRAKGVD